MKKVTILLSMVGLIAMVSFTNMQDKQPEPWPVPDEYKNMENPTADNQQTVNLGKSLYMRHCASCHGRTGLGDGPKSRNLKTFSGDFSGDFYQNQTDGEHFYKTLKGREEMPGYEGKMSEDDIWAIVRYMRTFDK